MRIHDALLIGCGGTGGYLAEPLARLMHFHPNASGSLTLADGDTFDEGNATRQVFPVSDLGRNKAESTAARLVAALPPDASPPIPVPSYVAGMRLAGMLAEYRAVQRNRRRKDAPSEERPALLLIMAVDNHATRNSVFRVLTECEDLDFLAISPGNGLDRGQVLTWGRVWGQTTGPSPLDAHPELRDPADRLPGGCAQQAPSTPQLIGANMGSATFALWAVQSWLDGAPIFDCMAFDTRRAEAAGLGQPIVLPGGAVLV